MKKQKAFLTLYLLSLLGCNNDFDLESNYVGDDKNILIIVADDLGTEVGFMGDNKARTPNLDELASNSIVFTNAYVTQSSCSPSRSSILSGLYPHTIGQIGLSSVKEFSMHSWVKTIPDYFENTNYYTGILGKVHVTPRDHVLRNFHWKNHLSIEETRDFTLTTRRVDEFLGKASKRNWFLMLNLYDPHRKQGEFINQINGLPSTLISSSNVDPLPFQNISNEEQLNDIAGYYNSVSRLDQGVGMILALLKERGIYDQTIVMILSDHGSPFTRAKTSLYESGIKVPFLIYFPNKEYRPRREDSFISTVDILPTVLDIIGYDKEPPYKLHGKSLLPLINQDTKGIRESLVAEFTYHGKEDYYPRRSIRLGNYKLIHNLDTTQNFPFKSVDKDEAYYFALDEKNKLFDLFSFYSNPTEYEFYDLLLDPYETKNLLKESQYQTKIEEMKIKLEAWRTEFGDIME